MASKQAQAIRTEVYHDDEEKAVRARSQHSRSAHIPTTDDDGNVVFDDGHPVPECGVEPKTDTEWVLRPVGFVSNRDKCSRCFDAGGVAEQNKKNGGSASFARKLRYGEDWGDESSSANASQGKGD
jgi:hypothetical protein